MRESIGFDLSEYVSVMKIAAALVCAIRCKSDKGKFGDDDKSDTGKT